MPETESTSASKPESDTSTITVSVLPYVARALGFDHRKPSQVSRAHILINSRLMATELPETSTALALKLAASLSTHEAASNQ